MRYSTFSFCTALLALFIGHGALHANNISVANTTFTDGTGGTATIQFDISWENSWRGSGVINWDAAWVFVKYKQSNGVWRHARLAENGHTAPAGSMIDNGLLTPGAAYHANTNPVVGVFIRRDADGTGTFTANGVQLFWDHGAQGILTANDIAEVRVFAIEMVYVNEGPFWVGAVGHVLSEEGFGSVPTSFPKGYQAFYCMKYEIAQQQYVDFLNCLTREQQNTRVGTDIAPGVSSVTDRYVMPGSATTQWRNAIRCDATIDPQAPVHFYCDANGNGTGGEADDGQWVAANYLNAFDLAAYLDWSALRIMTMYEYEKVCRGPLEPVPGEYAWGNALAVEWDHGYTLEGTGTAQEGIASGYSTTSGNMNWGGGGPVRVGIFAAHPTNTGRMASGAGYYGAMELTGNVGEYTMEPTTNYGALYWGWHGEGNLHPNGENDVASWPSPGFVPVDGQHGFTIKGGGGGSGIPASIGSTVSAGTVMGHHSSATGRWEAMGGRGVRTAP